MSRTARTLALMLVAVAALTLGDICLAKAMQGLGEIHLTELASLRSALARMLTPPGIWPGLLLTATFFFLWLKVLSFAELSFALPLTALNYVLTGLLAGPLLGEEVGLQRWLGMLLITAGVVVVSLGEASRPEPGSD